MYQSCIVYRVCNLHCEEHSISRGSLGLLRQLDTAAHD